MRRHEHEFTGLWSHFGPYGDQTIHIHSCFTLGCPHVLIGTGRDCDGDPDSHYRHTLSAASGRTDRPPAVLGATS